jgi:hypothetical protein
MAEFPIAINDRRAQYTASGGQTIFPYDFPVFADSELAVYRTRADVTTTLTLSADYTADGIGAQAGGNVTLTSGATLNDVITIVGAMPNARATDFQEGGDFRARVINLELDRLQIQIQELRNLVDRSLRLDLFDDPQTFNKLPSKAGRAGNLLKFDANGNPDTIAAGSVGGGVLEADAAQAGARAASGVYISPRRLLDAAASETLAGTAEIATQPETGAGLDDARIVTPLKHAVDARLRVGGWGAARNLNVVTSGAAAVAITADEIVLKDTSNNTLVARSVNVTPSIAASGANGLDTGAEAANTWYHGYVIAKPDGTVAGLLSTSATSPTMPSGYTYKALVTAVRNDGSSNFFGYYQAGNEIRYVAAKNNVFTATYPTTETNVNVGTFVPPIAGSFTLSSYGGVSNTNGTAINVQFKIRVTSGNEFLITTLIMQATNGNQGFGFTAECPNVSQTIFYLWSSNTGFSAQSYSIDILGFKLPVGGE